MQSPGAASQDLSYWPADPSEPLLEVAVGDVLREAAGAAADAVGLIAGVAAPAERRRWTYAEMLEEAERAARGLLGRFAVGERIAIWAPNLPEWVLLAYGAALAGVTVVTVNPAYRPRELAYVLRQSRAAGIFLVPEFRGSPMLEFLESVRPELPGLREVVRFDDWRGFCASGSPTERLPDVRPTDVAQIQYTSGTTGFPKGALLHHLGITNNGRFVAQRLGVTSGSVWINPMPLFHTAGCVLGALGAASSRATFVPVLAFEPALVLELIESLRGNVVGGAPTMFHMMLGHPERARRDLTSLRAVYMGGTLVPPELVRRAEAELRAPVSIVFGTTETSCIASQTRAEDAPRDRAETIGRALPQTEVKIVEPKTGRAAPRGTIGELCVRGYLVMRGYFEMPDATAAAIDAEGWYHTGDLAAMDERGYCRVEGRLTDMIIRGGENLYPREIEAALLLHPAVAEAAVVGVPDPTWGEVVAAFLRLAPGQVATEEELFAFCREQLAPFKTPKRWVFVERFPLTASGKIQKFVLRDQLLASRSGAGDGQ